MARPCALSFARSLDLERQRMHAAGNFVSQQRVDGAMAFDAGLSRKIGRDDLHPEMGLAAVAGAAVMARVSCVLVGLDRRRSGIGERRRP